MIKVWRIYEKPIPDGYKILVDRLWPRGIKKYEIDYWAKDIAPSNNLRKWYSHDPEKWDDFIKKYKEELLSNKEFENFKNMLKKELEKRDVIFLYGSKEKNYNNATALKLLIENFL